ncbi:AAA family ATPase [Vibrio cholerae]|uniref:AAA family ATPase n=1 Tax=Vibrio TaxID=662 RepID=UPI0001BB7E69|nr:MULTISPECIES: AAA family ATPase [Vibrio]EEZ00500.1 putative phage-related protein [Vibrio sp. RC586]EII2378944.1 AAA family ATPase [Vibrio cholerae]EJL6916352.1 AAA family ATPase [Vibrio cholerae]
MEKSDLYLTFTDENRAPKVNEVILYAEDSSWNDFGYKIGCTLRVLTHEENKNFEVRAFIGFFDPRNSELDEELKNVNYKTTSYLAMLPIIRQLEKRSALDKLGFFTMLPDMEAYRYAVSYLGPEFLEKVLRIVNDLVLYKDKKNKWIPHAMNSDVFKLGFMRHSSSFFAFNNADSVLGGVEEEKFDGISQELTLRYELAGFENDHEIKLKYDHTSIIPKRINVLIGRNGLGKSQALMSFCRAALRYPDKGISLSTSDSNGRPVINRLLAIATPGETQNTFPSERVKTQKLYYRRLSLTRNGRAKTTKTISDMLVQLARSEDSIGKKTRWDIFIDAISKVLPIKSLVIESRDKKYVGLADLGWGGGEQASLERWGNIAPNAEPKIMLAREAYPLSSGQLTFMKFAILCCLYIENGSFVLLDEPETHMHPNMISDFVGLLDEILENTGSLALIATHSAYFVREIPQDQVHVFKKEANNVCISNPRLTTFGAPVDSISRFVFDDDAESKLAEKLYRRIKRQNTTFEDIVNKLGYEISVAAMMKLRQKMEEA